MPSIAHVIHSLINTLVLITRNAAFTDLSFLQFCNGLAFNADMLLDNFFFEIIKSRIRTRPGHTDPRKKYYFFWAPIRKAHEYVLNLRRRLIWMIFKHAGHPPKFCRFTVTKHPYLRALTPKKSKRKKKYVPYELGSQIVLRIYSESQIFRIF